MQEGVCVSNRGVDRKMCGLCSQQLLMLLHMHVEAMSVKHRDVKRWEDD